MNSLIVSSGTPNGFTLFYATFTLEHTVLLTDKYILYPLAELNQCVLDPAYRLVANVVDVL